MWEVLWHRVRESLGRPALLGDVRIELLDVDGKASHVLPDILQDDLVDRSAVGGS